MADYPTFPLSTYGTYGRMAPGSSLSHKPRILNAGFGNGYSQRTPDGMNSDPRVLTARFEKLDEEEALLIEGFLKERGGWQPFYHALPIAEKVLWTCDSWTRTYDEIDRETVTATFTECFDL